MEHSRSSPQLPSLSSNVRTSARPDLSTSRTIPVRDRTPIRHNRPSDTRARSRSRSEILLAYAAEQQQSHQPANITFLPSQSAPTTPPIYGAAHFISSAETAPFQGSAPFYDTTSLATLSNPYFDSSVLPHQQDNLYEAARRASIGTQVPNSALNPQEALYLDPSGPSSAPAVPSLRSNVQQYPTVTLPLESSPGENFRVLAARPKPQCWDHGCNGRQFSTFSNLLRHQRERSGNATKAVCPHCGTEFTRTTARNGHLYGGKCKGTLERSQTDSDQGSNDGGVSQ